MSHEFLQALRVNTYCDAGDSDARHWANVVTEYYPLQPNTETYCPLPAKAPVDSPGWVNLVIQDDRGAKDDLDQEELGDLNKYIYERAAPHQAFWEMRKKACAAPPACPSCPTCPECPTGPGCPECPTCQACPPPTSCPVCPGQPAPPAVASVTPSKSDNTWLWVVGSIGAVALVAKVFKWV